MRVLVTPEAGLKFEMGLSFVALGALRDLAMDRVAGVTANDAMLALVFPELGILPSMAVKANTFVR